ncbi:unnamed protein product [Paramecium sonneborni]|uniref:Uncharacterized protein n=1 Tax=Paramecium sonneborni TaxID=65129 RepID=A0A8S1KXB4_9CILI|nr:unnamed protein product [Paramecium sonneborni]
MGALQIWGICSEHEQRLKYKHILKFHPTIKMKQQLFYINIKEILDKSFFKTFQYKIILYKYFLLLLLNVFKSQELQQLLFYKIKNLNEKNTLKFYYFNNYMDQEQNSLGLLGILDFRLIQQISKYLMAREIFNLGLTNSFFKEQLLNFKKKEISIKKNSFVTNDGIELYLELDISDIYDKIAIIQAIVETKDQGWATVPYSSSWVTLTLFNEQQDYLTHQQQPFEQRIYSNYKEKQFAERRLTITEAMNVDNSKKQLNESILGLSRKGQFKKLGIVQKCLEIAWECYLKSAKIIVFYRD